MNTTQATQQWADRILASLELTREQIPKHVVAIAPGVIGNVEYYKLKRDRLAGLNSLGHVQGPDANPHQGKAGKHADISHLPLAERRRIIAQRWRAEKKAAKLASNI